MLLQYVCEPCHNFSIMSRLLIPSDPRDGREKLALCNYAADNTGSLHIVDTQTLEGESYPFPNDSGAWALCLLPEREEVLIGTCDHLGSLHCFSLRTRTFAKPLRIEGEMYLYHFALAGDGCIYAGTYPGAKLVRYDPQRQVLDDLGHVGNASENHYTQMLCTLDNGNLLVMAAHAKKQIYLYDVKKQAFAGQVGLDGDVLLEARAGWIAVERDGKRLFFRQTDFSVLEGPFEKTDAPETAADTDVRAWLHWLMRPEPIPDLPAGSRGEKTADGAIVGAKGQEVFRSKDGVTRFAHIPGNAPATSIMTIAAEGNRLWGSCENGQTIFTYDPQTGETWNSNAVCNAGGEVYGVVPYQKKVFLSAYVGGDHVVYDPTKPWDQRGNQNPKTLRSVGPDLVRPNSRSVLAPDGGIWTGWYAKYGVYGGGVSRIDPETCDVESWTGPVAGQSVEYICAGRTGVYLTTGGIGNGLEELACAPHLIHIGRTGETLADYVFAENTWLPRLFATDSAVYATPFDMVRGVSTLTVHDPETLKKTGEWTLGGADARVTDLLLLGENVLLFTHAEAILLRHA